MESKEISQNLNQEQLKAVSFGKGPLLIIAGAGTGKTTVITNRINYLIMQQKIKPEEILALTFTEKAAGEMEERVDKLLPYGYVDLWISTFHSFAERILKQEGLNIGLSNEFQLLNETQSWMLVRKNLELFDLEYYKPLGNPTKFIHALIKHFSRCKDEEVYPKDYLKYSEKLELNKDTKQGDKILDDEALRIKEIASAYHQYQQLLLDNNAMDFGDLINYTLKLFKTRPAILKEYQKKFKYILVDEFQDTNYAQYDLIKMLLDENQNITVVADDDQSIYKFRGASVSNILKFQEDFPKTEKVVLTQNYRSAQEILDLSYNFIQLNNPDRLEIQGKVNKKLKSESKEKAVIEHIHKSSLDGEIEAVAKKIIELKEKEPELNWNDFAVLVRANDSATAFTNYFKQIKLPHLFYALRGLYNKPVILDVLAFFKLLDNYHESAAVYRILTSPVFDFSFEELSKISHFARRKTFSLYEALKNINLVPQITEETMSETNRVLALVEKYSQLSIEKSPSQVYLGFLKDSGYLEILTSKETLENKQSLNHLNQFYKKVQDYEASITEPRVKEFLNELELEIDAGDTGSLSFDPESGPDLVNIMTIHSAKGLEFKYVFIPNMVDLKFPTTERKEPILLPEDLIKDILPTGDVHIQEERRLFYVAMTRAKKGLFLTSAKNYGGVREKKISRFLKELKETNPDFTLNEGTNEEKIKNKLLDEQKIVKYQEEKFTWVIPSPFSFSQIAAFSKCPYQYKFSFLYKIPVFGKPVFSYGKSIHSALQKIMDLYMSSYSRPQQDLFGAIEKASSQNGQSVRKEVKITQEQVLDILKESWIDDWYESKQQKQEYFNKAKEAIKLFYKELKKNPPDVLFLEKGFNLKLTEEGIIYPIKGFIDRVDILSDNTAEVIDYKTGSAKDKLTFDEKIQLILYQIALEEVFNQKVSKLTFYYVDENKKLSFEANEKDIEKTKSIIKEAIAQIKVSNFPAHPSQFVCKYCDFNSICEYKV